MYRCFISLIYSIIYEVIKMAFTYQIITDWYVRSVPVGAFLYTKGLIEFVLRTSGKQIGPMKASSFLDANANCLADRGSSPRRWKRIA
jgi:hypothetical protein